MIKYLKGRAMFSKLLVCVCVFMFGGMGEKTLLCPGLSLLSQNWGIPINWQKSSITFRECLKDDSDDDGNS